MFCACEKGNQPVAVLAHFAGDVVLELRQVCAFGLADVEDVNGAEANQHGRGLRVLIRARLLLCRVSPAPMADHRRENLDALLALLHKSAQLVPCADARNARGRRALSRNGKNVAESSSYGNGPLRRDTRSRFRSCPPQAAE